MASDFEGWAVAFLRLRVKIKTIETRIPRNRARAGRRARSAGLLPLKEGVILLQLFLFRRYDGRIPRGGTNAVIWQRFFRPEPSFTPVDRP